MNLMFSYILFVKMQSHKNKLHFLNSNPLCRVLKTLQGTKIILSIDLQTILYWLNLDYTDINYHQLDIHRAYFGLFF